MNAVETSVRQALESTYNRNASLGHDEPSPMVVWAVAVAKFDEIEDRFPYEGEKVALIDMIKILRPEYSADYPAGFGIIEGEGGER